MRELSQSQLLSAKETGPQRVPHHPTICRDLSLDILEGGLPGCGTVSAGARSCLHISIHYTRSWEEQVATKGKS